jgi:hypothetical protein
MSEDEQGMIVKLYETGVIQIIICSYKMSWELELRAYLVAI